MNEKRRMPRAVDYYCDNCNYIQGELFMPNEEILDMLKTFCVSCGGIMRKRDFKNNSQRVYVNDPQG